MSIKGARILVVEDEPAQNELLAYNLSKEGYSVVSAESAEEAFMLVEESEFDLILMDWMLPSASGIEATRRIKRSKDNADIPIIMLTARGEEEDKIRGLDTGAEDYVVKPYSVKELLARVRAGLRRANASLSTDLLSYNEIKMDLKRHKVTVAEQTVTLGPLEFKLLRTFLERPGRVCSRDQLLDWVWKDAFNIDTRTVDVHVGRLRKQLAKVSENGFIRTVRGFGYSLDTEI